MFRYVTLLWRGHDRAQSDAAQLLKQRLLAYSRAWREVSSQSGMQVLCADSRPGWLEPHVLPNGAGVVLGAAFDARRDWEDETPSRRLAFGAGESEAIAASRGRWLIEHCWGDYVAFIAPQDPQRAAVLRAPTGNLPVFMTRFRNVCVFFSCVTDCLRAGLNFTLNHDALASRVVGAAGASTLQTLEGVSQVHRGEHIDVDLDAVPARLERAFQWRPTQFPLHDELIDDPDYAARALRATVRSCTSTWASCHSSVLHRLSGGLDSSIIAGCLANVPSGPRVTCYTYYNPAGRSDERPWARLAAAHARSEHIEVPLRPGELALAEAPQPPPAVEPASFMSCIVRTVLESPLAKENGATAVFSGDGGDSNFCSDSVSYAATEYLRRLGPRAAVWRLAADVGLATDRSAWSVLARSLRAWLRASEHEPRRQLFLSGLRMVNPQITDSFSVSSLCVHPWFADTKPMPWPTIIRMGALLCTPDAYNVADAEGVHPDVIAPLYSQPVVELCLRIPLYSHFEGGRDRGLARRAFADEAPAAIRTRMWKDRIPGFHDALLKRNADFIRDMLLDGVLVGTGLLDRAAVEREFSGRSFGAASSMVEIFRHLDLEIWARRWSQQVAARIAA